MDINQIKQLNDLDEYYAKREDIAYNMIKRYKGSTTIPDKINLIKYREEVIHLQRFRRHIFKIFGDDLKTYREA